MARQSRSPLTRYAAVQQKYDRQLVAALERAARDCSRSIAQLDRSGNELRAAQMRFARAAILRRTGQLWAEIGDLVKAGQREAAANAAEEVALRDTAFLLRASAGDVADNLLAAELRRAESNVDLALARMFNAPYSLSQRVYRTSALANGMVDALINTALAEGLSARELAQRVRRYISARTPGGVSYAAERLARTELNNAFHAQTIALDAGKPWILGQKWNLSGSHPKPDACNDLASAPSALGTGVWPNDDVPPKPHPQCLCYITAVTPSAAEFARRFRSGEYDEWFSRNVPGGIPAVA